MSIPLIPGERVIHSGRSTSSRIIDLFCFLFFSIFLSVNWKWQGSKDGMCLTVLQKKGFSHVMRRRLDLSMPYDSWLSQSNLGEQSMSSWTKTTGNIQSIAEILTLSPKRNQEKKDPVIRLSSQYTKIEINNIYREIKKN